MSRNYEDYVPLIRKFARRYRDIDDALQEAWLCYCETDHDFDEQSGRYFISYLQERLRWHFKKLIRNKQKQQQLLTALQQQPHILPDNSSSSFTAVTVESSERKLPPRTRTATNLMAAGYSLSEAARIMKVRPQTLFSMLKRVR